MSFFLTGTFFFFLLFVIGLFFVPVLVFRSLSVKSNSKYHNKRIEIDGIWFDSMKEGATYQNLKLLKKTGAIRSFERQEEYPLVVNGQMICKYRCDFRVVWKDGRIEIWDVKGFRTREYRIKKKLMAAIHKIEILEI